MFLELRADHVVYLSFMKGAFCQCKEFSIRTEKTPILFNSFAPT